jgi:hypothetical protein
MKLSKLFSKGEREPQPKVVRHDDVFIVSYPKSGNTWQRFLVANLVHPGEEITFLTINRIVPDSHQVPEEELGQIPSPRLLKSHEAFTPRYPKAIYITRDPRSVAVSMYHFLMATHKLETNHSIDDFLDRFIRGEYYRHFHSWSANVMSWVSELDRGNKNVLLIRYEDLKANTAGELRRVADFLQRAVSDDIIAAAVANSSFEKMQGFEQERQKVNPRKNWDSSRQFVRKGAVDEWKQTFSPAQVEKICQAFAEPMRRMKYL